MNCDCHQDISIKILLFYETIRIRSGYCGDIIGTKHTNAYTTNFNLPVNRVSTMFLMPPDNSRTLKFFMGIQEGREQYGHFFQHSHMRYGKFTI